MRKLFINLFWTINIIAAIAIVAAFIAPFINPNHIGVVAYFGIGFPILLYINTFFVIFWLFVKRKYMWLSLLLILLGFPMISRHLQIFPKRTDTKEGIKILSYNIRNFQQLGSKNKKSTMESIAHLISGQKPDIVCIQEFPKTKKIPKGIINLDMPAYGQGGNIIFTKLKVVNQGIVISEKDNKFGIYTDILFHNDTVRVINIQLLSYSVSRELEMYENTEKVNRKRFLFSVASKLNSGFTRRVNETEKLTKAISKSHYPIILCGDFNDPPDSFTYQKIISTGLKDAFVESGTGYGNTYKWSFPKVRIDYIMTSNKFDIYNYNVLHTNLSDHYPVEALLVIKE